MSNKRIVDLPSADTITGAEQFELVQSSASVNATLTVLLALKTENIAIITANYNANTYDYIIADTTAGVFTITLPASPVLGNIIWFVDGAGTWNTNNLIISGNGNNILGNSNTLVSSVARNNFSLVYYNTPQGWVMGD